MKQIYKYSLLVWFFFSLVAITNGIVRNYIYKPLFGDLIAHQISTFILIGVFFFMMYFFFNRLGFDYSNKDLWIIGLSWLLLTVIFEFVFGHYVFGNPWEKLVADYNILEGRIWSLVLLFMLVGPRMIGRKAKKL